MLGSKVSIGFTVELLKLSQLFFQRHEIGERLARVLVVAQAVDDGNARPARRFADGGVGERGRDTSLVDPRSGSVLGLTGRTGHSAVPDAGRPRHRLRLRRPASADDPQIIAHSERQASPIWLYLDLVGSS